MPADPGSVADAAGIRHPGTAIRQTGGEDGACRAAVEALQAAQRGGYLIMVPRLASWSVS